VELRDSQVDITCTGRLEDTERHLKLLATAKACDQVYISPEQNLRLALRSLDHTSNMTTSSTLSYTLHSLFSFDTVLI
jgi:hypothetical protein